MSKQQKDNPSSGSTGAGSMPRSDTTSHGGEGQGQGLRRQERDDTGGPRGDALGGAVDAAAGGTSNGTGNGTSAPPDNKGGASAA